MCYRQRQIGDRPQLNTELLAKQSDGLVTAAGRGADEVTKSGSALANASSSAFKAADDVAASKK